MKALTIKQPFSSLVAYGAKTIEFRRSATSYRGPLLICASKDCVFDGDLEFPYGVAVAVCMVAGVEPFTEDHLDRACMDTMPSETGYAWHLIGAKEIIPFPVRGIPGLFDVGETAVLIDDEDPKDHIDYWMVMSC